MRVRQWVHGLWLYYRRYTRSAIHTAAAAALAIFGLLVFIDPRFAGVAIAAYVCPPVVLYILGVETGPEASPDESTEHRTDHDSSRDATFETDTTSGLDTNLNGSDGDSDSDSTGTDTDSDDRDIDTDSDSGDTDTDSDG